MLVPKNWIIFFVLSLLLTNGAWGIKTVKLHGVAHVNLNTLADGLKMKVTLTKAPKLKATLKSKWTSIEFSVHDRFFFLNGTKVFLGGPIISQQQWLYISKKDYDLSLKPILIPQSTQSAPRLTKIVIDPGHGGKDIGTQNTSLRVKEKDLALKMALKLEKKLKKEGFMVTLTRRGDTTVSLSKRSEFSNKAKADLFISLHLNYAEAKQAKGIETFIFTNPYQPSTGRTDLVKSDKVVQPANANNSWSTLSGYYIQSELSSAMPTKDRGLRRARWGVLKNLECPGVLIEIGFLSNPEESRNLISATYQDKLVNAITSGVLAYQKKLERIHNRS